MEKINSYAIVDENGKYVHRNSIRKTGKEYFYLPYDDYKDGCWIYTKKERVEEALKNLEIHNRLGNLGHKFKIIEIHE